jgi:hypothetical protein
MGNNGIFFFILERFIENFVFIFVGFFREGGKRDFGLTLECFEEGECLKLEILFEIEVVDDLLFTFDLDFILLFDFDLLLDFDLFDVNLLLDFVILLEERYKKR